MQGHVVHVVGMGEAWGRELPGLSERGEDGKRVRSSEKEGEKERMKIAWRYEGLGVFGERGTSTSCLWGEIWVVKCLDWNEV